MASSARPAQPARSTGHRPPLALTLLVALVGALPWRALSTLAWLPAVLAFDVARVRRREVTSGLARIGLKSSSIARSAVHRLATSALEFLWMSAHPDERLDGRVSVDGWDAFESRRALGRGVIVATAHTGNWDLAACACAERTRLAVLTKRLSSPRLDAFWQSTRAARGVELIAAPDGEAIVRAKAILRSGGAVAVLIDQDPRRAHSVVEGEFLGRNALHDPLVAVLAARTGAAIVTAFSRRDDGGGQIVEVRGVDVGARVAIAPLTRELAARLDAFVRAWPREWLWLHRRWSSATARHHD